MIWELFQADICYCVHSSLLSFSLNKKLKRMVFLFCRKCNGKPTKVCYNSKKHKRMIQVISDKEIKNEMVKESRPRKWFPSIEKE